MTPKKKAWYWCSRYCRLRDAIEYCSKYNINTGTFSKVEDLPVQCCTCKIVKSWVCMDAGHYKGRGLGGGSGTYFDERNIHAQSKDCNAFKQGSPQEYETFLIDKYGPKIIEELNRKHVLPIDMRPLAMKATEQFFKEKYADLVAGL